jgi:hypothetical protein
MHRTALITRIKGNGLISAKSLRIDLIFFYVLPGLPRKPFDTTDGRRRFGQALFRTHFGIRHFSKESDASERCRRLHF